MLLLELHAAQVAERRLQPLGVVDLVDEARKVSRDIGESFVLRHVHCLDLERFHEALGLGVVVGIAVASHRADQYMLGQHLPVGGGGILRSAVGMMHAALGRRARR